MKRCPFCSNEIQDEAIKCRYCKREVTGSPTSPEPSSAAGPDRPGGPDQVSAAPPGARVGEGALRFTHSGYRYLLGYGTAFFGIWDRQHAGGPVFTFPRTDEGWAEAWNRFAAWEPGAVEVPGGGPAPGANPAAGFVPAHGPAVWTIVLLAVNAVVGVAAVAAWARRIADLTSLRGVGDFHHTAGATGAAAAQGLILYANIACGIAWLIWQFRAQRNLRALGADGLRYSPGWAIAWWFVPFANVVMPFFTVRELFQAGEPGSGAIDWKRRATPVVLALWWGTFIGSRVLALAAAGIATQRANPVGSVILQSALILVADAVLVAAALLAIALVRRIDADQRAKAERLRSWSGQTATATASAWASSAPSTPRPWADSGR